MILALHVRSSSFILRACSYISYTLLSSRVFVHNPKMCRTRFVSTLFLFACWFILRGFYRNIFTFSLSRPVAESSHIPLTTTNGEIYNCCYKFTMHHYPTRVSQLVASGQICCPVAASASVVTESRGRSGHARREGFPRPTASVWEIYPPWSWRILTYGHGDIL